MKLHRKYCNILVYIYKVGDDKMQQTKKKLIFLNENREIIKEGQIPISEEDLERLKQNLENTPGCNLHFNIP